MTATEPSEEELKGAKSALIRWFASQGIDTKHSVMLMADLILDIVLVYAEASDADPTGGLDALVADMRTNLGTKKSR